MLPRAKVEKSDDPELASGNAVGISPPPSFGDDDGCVNDGVGGVNEGVGLGVGNDGVGDNEGIGSGVGSDGDGGFNEGVGCEGDDGLGCEGDDGLG